MIAADRHKAEVAHTDVTLECCFRVKIEHYEIDHMIPRESMDCCRPRWNSPAALGFGVESSHCAACSLVSGE